MENILQFIATYWWYLILIFVLKILELYVVPKVITQDKNQNSVGRSRFPIIALCIFGAAVVQFIINIPESDPTWDQKIDNTENSIETSTTCGGIYIHTYGSATPPPDIETVTQSDVDSLILASKVRELSIDEIGRLTQEELALLRNAIFAMAGRQYGKGTKYYAIFQSYDWYNPYIPGKDFTWDYFNHYQFKNMNKIVNYEKSMGYRK